MSSCSVAVIANQPSEQPAWQEMCIRLRKKGIPSLEALVALYVVLALSALILGPWLVGFAISAWIDASRPREVETSVPLPADRLAMVQRLTEEWQEVRSHWVSSPEDDEEHRAA